MSADVSTAEQHAATAEHPARNRNHQMTSDSTPRQAGFAGQSSEQCPASQERCTKRRPEAAREL